MTDSNSRILPIAPTMPLPAFDPGAPPLLPLAMMLQEQPATGQAGEAGTLEPSSPADGSAKPPPPTWLMTLGNAVPLILIGLLFYFLIVGGGKRRDKQRQQQLSTLTRGDRVTTIGGIIGSVVDATGDEVVLKIDENNNTKVRILRSAVANVLRSDAGEKKS